MSETWPSSNTNLCKVRRGCLRKRVDYSLRGPGERGQGLEGPFCGDMHRKAEGRYGGGWPSNEATGEQAKNCEKASQETNVMASLTLETAQFSISRLSPMYTPEKTSVYTYWTTFYVNINRPSQISGGIAVSNVIQLCHKLLALKIDLFLIILHWPGSCSLYTHTLAKLS